MLQLVKKMGFIGILLGLWIALGGSLSVYDRPMVPNCRDSMSAKMFTLSSSATSSCTPSHTIIFASYVTAAQCVVLRSIDVTHGACAVAFSMSSDANSIYSRKYSGNTQYPSETNTYNIKLGTSKELKIKLGRCPNETKIYLTLYCQAY